MASFVHQVAVVEAWVLASAASPYVFFLSLAEVDGRSWVVRVGVESCDGSVWEVGADGWCA